MRAKILLIDPDEKEINSFQHILETEGHRTRKAHSVEAGLRLCEDDNFDLIFISSNLKDVVINDLIRKLRQLNPDTEFIIITNLSQLQSLASMSHFDIAGYLIPPITDDKVREITQRALRQREVLRDNRRLLEAITQAKKEWEATVDAIEDPIFIVDLENRIIRANLALFKFLNKGVSEVIGQKCHKLIHQLENCPPDCVMKPVKAEGAPSSVEIECKGLGGKYFLAAYPQIFEGGFGVVHFLRALKSTELDSRYHRLFERSPLPFLVLEYDTRKIVDANDLAGDLLGFGHNELLGLTFDSFLPAGDRDYILMSLPRSDDQSQPRVKASILNREHEKIEVTFHFGSVIIKEKPFLQVVIVP